VIDPGQRSEINIAVVSTQQALFQAFLPGLGDTAGGASSMTLQSKVSLRGNGDGGFSFPTWG
jgi:hypothetical protein